MVAARSLYEVIVDVCPVEQKNLGRAKSDVRAMRILCAVQSPATLFTEVNTLIDEQGLHLRKHVSFRSLRKVKGREGPGVISAEPLDQ